MIHHRHHPRVHMATHHMRHVAEYVEEARPFGHIIFGNYPAAVFFTLIAVGIAGLFNPLPHFLFRLTDGWWTITFIDYDSTIVKVHKILTRAFQ